MSIRFIRDKHHSCYTFIKLRIFVQLWRRDFNPAYYGTEVPAPIFQSSFAASGDMEPEEPMSREALKTFIKELRSRLPIDIIENVPREGYRLRE